MTPLVDRVRRLLTQSRAGVPTCLVCGDVIRDSDRRVRVRGETYVHRRCATYRMRQTRAGSDRLGHPPHWPRRP